MAKSYAHYLEEMDLAREEKRRQRRAERKGTLEAMANYTGSVARATGNAVQKAGQVAIPVGKDTYKALGAKGTLGAILGLGVCGLSFAAPLYVAAGAIVARVVKPVAWTGKALETIMEAQSYEDLDESAKFQWKEFQTNPAQIPAASEYSYRGEVSGTRGIVLSPNQRVNPKVKESKFKKFGHYAGQTLNYALGRVKNAGEYATLQKEAEQESKKTGEFISAESFYKKRKSDKEKKNKQKEAATAVRKTVLAQEVLKAIGEEGELITTQEYDELLKGYNNLAREANEKLYEAEVDDPRVYFRPMVNPRERAKRDIEKLKLRLDRTYRRMGDNPGQYEKEQYNSLAAYMNNLKENIGDADFVKRWGEERAA